uniref:P-type ATPase superfamily n=1 Tax=uncultured bacterium AB1650 TaxID=1047164 RepID=F6LWB4_9BACT|nr:p-type ATPase superfamily [uncultured bacterium AB1650]
MFECPATPSPLTTTSVRLAEGTQGSRTRRADYALVMCGSASTVDLQAELDSRTTIARSPWFWSGVAFVLIAGPRSSAFCLEPIEFPDDGGVDGGVFFDEPVDGVHPTADGERFGELRAERERR